MYLSLLNGAVDRGILIRGGVDLISSRRATNIDFIDALFARRRKEVATTRIAKL